MSTKAKVTLAAFIAALSLGAVAPAASALPFERDVSRIWTRDAHRIMNRDVQRIWDRDVDRAVDFSVDLTTDVVTEVARGLRQIVNPR